jgi:hypothetical protein
MNIVNFQQSKSAEELRQEHIAIMWLLFLRTSNRAEPLEDGSYYIGDVGEEKSSRGVERWCPYAPARGLKP